MKTLKANSGVTYLGTPVYIVNLDYTNEKGEDLGALISFNTSAVMLIKRINLLRYVKTIDCKSCELSPDLHDKVIEKISRQFVIVEGGMTKIKPRKYDDISKDDVIHMVQSSIQAFKDSGSEDLLDKLAKRLKNTMGVKSLLWDSYNSKNARSKGSR